MARWRYSKLSTCDEMVSHFMGDIHYSDVKWASRRFRTPDNRVFVQQFLRVNIGETSKVRTINPVKGIGGFPPKWPVIREAIPFESVIMGWIKNTIVTTCEDVFLCLLLRIIVIKRGLSHQNDVTWVSWRLKSSATWLSVHQFFFFQADNEDDNGTWNQSLFMRGIHRWPQLLKWCGKCFHIISSSWKSWQ